MFILRIYYLQLWGLRSYKGMNFRMNIALFWDKTLTKYDRDQILWRQISYQNCIAGSSSVFFFCNFLNVYTEFLYLFVNHLTEFIKSFFIGIFAQVFRHLNDYRYKNWQFSKKKIGYWIMKTKIKCRFVELDW